MPLKFHQPAIDLLGFQPPFSSEAVAQLNQTERDCGFTFPPSVREWYALENAVAIMTEHSNNDHFLTIPDLGRKAYESTHPDSLSESLLWFMTENQGNCDWAIKLDGSDDPEVLIKVEDRTVWQPCAPHFSIFVWSLVFDFNRKFDYYFMAQTGTLSAGDLAYLRKEFQIAPSTYTWPGQENYRFHREAMKILIWSNPGQADWYLSAETPEALYTLGKSLWNYSDLSKTLYATNKASENVLMRLKD